VSITDRNFNWRNVLKSGRSLHLYACFYAVRVD